MNPLRNLFVLRFALGIALGAVALVCHAQAYPTKPVRLIVGMAPGGSNDTVARMIGAELSKTFPQPVVVENKPGANSTIATAELKRATPDGYTLMLVISSHVTNMFLYPNLSYKLNDFAPVSLIAETPFLLVANPKFAPNNVRELITKAKSADSAVDFGTPGQGSTQHIAMELMDQMAGIKLNAIPYKGGAPAQTDLLAGQINLIFATPTQSMPFVKENKLKALGVTSAKRLEQLPDVPTLAESGLANFESYNWQGVIAPKGTPREIMLRLNQELNAILRQPDMREAILSQASEPVGGTPEEFAAFIKAEAAKWSAVVKTANIQPE